MLRRCNCSHNLEFWLFLGNSKLFQPFFFFPSFASSLLYIPINLVSLLTIYLTTFFFGFFLKAGPTVSQIAW